MNWLMTFNSARIAFLSSAVVRPSRFQLFAAIWQKLAEHRQFLENLYV